MRVDWDRKALDGFTDGVVRGFGVQLMLRKAANQIADGFVYGYVREGVHVHDSPTSRRSRTVVIAGSFPARCHDRKYNTLVKGLEQVRV